MEPQLFIAIAAGLGGMFGWGFSEFATKVSVDRVGTFASLVWAHVFGTTILFFVLILRFFITQTAITLPLGLDDWLGVLFFGSLQTVVYYFAYKGFEKGQVSILSPIFASFAGFVALASVLIFKETLNIGLVPALLLIFIGVIVINLDMQATKVWHIRVRGVPGLREILIATMLATFWTLGWDKFAGGKDWMIYTTLMFVFMTLSAFILARLNNVYLLKIQSGAWRFLWLIAAGEVLAYLAITFGYSTTSYTSVVAILSGASSLLTILLAQFFLKEKMTKMQAFACILIITGVIILSIY